MTAFDCNKKQYRSFKNADFDARQLRRKYGEPEEPYYCKNCQCWHVGARSIKWIKRTEKRQERRI